MKRRRNTKRRGWLRAIEWVRPAHLLLLTLVSSLALMGLHAGDAFGGFHGGTNEPFYTLLGRSIAQNPLSYPHKADGGVDYNIPPLTAYVLGWDFIFFGESEATARGAAIAFSLASVILVYLIGRRLYDERTGLIASAVFAFTPMEVIVGRNVQTDPFFLAFALAGVYLYLEGRFAYSGLMLGLSFLAKQPSVVFLGGLVALELLKERRDFGGLARLFGAFIITASPYVAYNIYQNGALFLSGQASRVLLPVSAEGGNHGMAMVVNETFWGLSPLISVAFVAGLGYMALNRRREDVPAALFSLLLLAFFAVYNKHSYYILPLAPFAALVISRLVLRLRAAETIAAASVVLILSGAFYSVIMLCGGKYGFEAYKRLPEIYGKGGKPVIIIDELIAGSYIDGLAYYNPDAQIVDMSRLRVADGQMVPLDYSKPTYKLMSRAVVRPEEMAPELRQRFAEGAADTDRYALVLFGYIFYEAPLNQHFFTNTALQVKKAFPPSTTGIIKVTEEPDLYLIRLTGDERIFRDKGTVYSIRKAA